MRAAEPLLAPARTVGTAMLLHPRTAAPGVTVAEARAVLENTHVHAVLVVDRTRLVAVVEREDLVGSPGDAHAALVGRLDGRTIEPWADLGSVQRWMVRDGRRRLAVTDRAGTLLGLLCLKRSHRGFCSDADVDAREAGR
jgi:CBS domain-containing protein